MVFITVEFCQDITNEQIDIFVEKYQLSEMMRFPLVGSNYYSFNCPSDVNSKLEKINEEIYVLDAYADQVSEYKLYQ